MSSPKILRAIHRIFELIRSPNSNNYGEEGIAHLKSKGKLGKGDDDSTTAGATDSDGTNKKTNKLSIATIEEEEDFNDDSPNRELNSGERVFEKPFSVFDSIKEESELSEKEFEERLNGKFMWWRKTHASLFRIRNVGYSQTGEKIPSQGALYDCIGLDVVQPKKLMLKTVIEEQSERMANISISDDFNEEWGVPEILIINCLIPLQCGSMWSSHPKDDCGVNAVAYFRLSEEAKRLLNGPQNGSPGLNVYRDMLKQGRSDRQRIPMKMIAQCENMDDLNVPGMLKRYNGKPVLVTDSSFFITKNLPHMLEISFDVRQWAYMMRSQIGLIQKLFKDSRVNFGYLVEGRGEEYLPEQILACFTCCYCNTNDDSIKEVEGKNTEYK